MLGDVERILGSKEFISTLVRSASNFVFAPTVVYDRNLFTPELRYSEQFKYTSDLDLWFRVALRDPRVGFMPRPQITCGIHRDRLSHRHADSMRLEALAIIRNYVSILRRGHDAELINSRLAMFIEVKLRMYEAAIRLHLIPGFRLRRVIASALDFLAPRVTRRGAAG
jgi:hypothetical protein